MRSVIIIQTNNLNLSYLYIRRNILLNLLLFPFKLFVIIFAYSFCFTNERWVYKEQVTCSLGNIHYTLKPELY